MHPAYPRPQFVRDEWQSLEGAWQYSFAEQKRPAGVNWQGEICVPYPPEAPLSGVHDPGYHSVIWYRRQFRVPAAWEGRRVWLHFGAVDYLARVWVNDELVAEHEGGHTPFSIDITDALRPGEQTVIVRAEDDPHDLAKPRGKQDWEPEPHAIWYPRTSGIWQPVWIEPVATTALNSLRLTPNLDRFGIDLQATLQAAAGAEDLSLDVEICLGDTILIRKTLEVRDLHAGDLLTLPLPESDEVRRAFLWSPENPVLFDVLLTLRQGGAVLDRVTSYAGLRSVEARDGLFYLNGQPYFMQLVLDQGYWEESLLAAPSPEALRQDVELTKALGFNGVRKHQKIEDPRYLYWADRLGLLVWDELPSAYTFSSQAAQRLTQEFLAMIARDYNHPCVVAWVPFNESWGIPDVLHSAPQRSLAQSLYHLAKALDPTRLVIDNDGWEHSLTDLFTIHDYENKPDVFARRYSTDECLDADLEHGKKLAVADYDPRGLPVILSEFGGIRLGQGKGWGYQQVQTAEEFLASFAPLMKSVYGCRLTGYCYTQLTDTFQEQNGLLYMDRSAKLDPQVVRGILQAGLAEWTRQVWERMPQQVAPVGAGLPAVPQGGLPEINLPAAAAA